MTDVFYCGIIDGNMSVGGNNKVVFQNDKIVINGGFLYDYSSEMNYSDIKMTYYSTILPKVKFVMNDNSVFKMNIHLFKLPRMIRTLKKHNIENTRAFFRFNIIKWYKFWYA